MTVDEVARSRIDGQDSRIKAQDHRIERVENRLWQVLVTGVITLAGVIVSVALQLAGF